MTTNNAGDECENKTVSGIDLRKKRSLVFHFLYAIDCLGYDTSLDSVIDNFIRKNCKTMIDQKIATALRKKGYEGTSKSI